MDLTVVVVGALVVVGILGCIIPVLPGAVLTVGAILAYALIERTAASWVAFGIAAAAFCVALVIKYLIPGRQLQGAGIPNRSMFYGVLLGIVGFFVIPVVGLFVGFPGGVYLAELRRLRDQRQAWASTVHALKATGLSMLIETAGSVIGGLSWFVVVLTA